jgi:NDP-sugar pyrophosphorylase family protein
MSAASINIVIPMAGSGQRFVDAGYDRPKPFIDVAGDMMIARVLENLRYPDARYVLIARREQVEAHPDLVKQLCDRFPVDFRVIDGLTEGTAATLLFARGDFANDTPLLVANCDQLVDGGVAAMIDENRARGHDGSIMVFEDAARDPKWSFVRLDAQGLVQEAREKKAISEWATVGVYLFSRGADFREAAIESIIRNERVNNEFYTCPTYNHLVSWGRRIGIHTIAQSAMHGIGTPNDLAAYLASGPDQRA